MGIRASHLSELLRRSVSESPGRVAVEEASGASLTYAELGRSAERLATRLARWGVGREDRVGLFLPKSCEAVAAVHGILRAGAAYVPVDPTAPVARGAGILADAKVRAVVVSAPLAAAFRDHWPGPEPLPRLIVVGSAPEDATPPEAAPCVTTWEEIQADLAPAPLTPAVHVADLAYILYTSGSTGKPKGVMLSHANAIHFIDWCAETYDVRPGDRFSSHAPFHFDLSVFDLYVCCHAQGTLVLIGESLSKEPAQLGAFLREKRLDVWYSAPSILSLLTQYGGLDANDFPAPRIVLFAGEVFPIRYLRQLRDLWPQAELWNLYGPTETNVCTAQRIPPRIDPRMDQPFPIGPVIGSYGGLVVDEQGRPVPQGHEGELWISGIGVMRGYFGRPDLDASVFVRDEDGTQWYRTGDLVVSDAHGGYTYHGRRDRMVKRRGYRIELGEIEAAFYRHDDVEKVAVVAVSDENGVRITAFLAVKADRKASIIAAKRHCATHLPGYMVPDSIQFLPSLPMTSTDKVDYKGLQRLCLPLEGAA